MSVATSDSPSVATRFPTDGHDARNGPAMGSGMGSAGPGTAANAAEAKRGEAPSAPAPPGAPCRPRGDRRREAWSGPLTGLAVPPVRRVAGADAKGSRRGAACSGSGTERSRRRANGLDLHLSLFARRRSSRAVRLAATVSALTPCRPRGRRTRPEPTTPHRRASGRGSRP